MSMKLSKVKLIKKLRKDKVFDISHLIDYNNFQEDHPNLIANGLVISNCSRHAGGIIISENPKKQMPIIKSHGVLQTPWTEGANFRHLEPFGFLKFDILALGTLRMFENCIRRILKKQGNKYPTFEQVKEWYYENLHPANNDMDDTKVYKHVYWKSNYAGVFQFVRPQVQQMMAKMKPKSVKDIAIITSLFRPGPLCLSSDTDILTKVYFWGTGKKKRTNQYKTIEQLYNEFHYPAAHGKYKYQICSYDEEKKKLVANKITNVFKSGKKDVYEVAVQHCLKSYNTKATNTTRGNRALKLKATMEHRFLTIDGWKTLGDLESGDYILFLNRALGGRSSKVGIQGERNFNNIAFMNYRHKCIFCNWNKGALDVNHIEGNRRNNNNTPENLCFMCPNHHREFTEGSLSKREVKALAEKHRLLKNDDVRAVKFISAKHVGREETYDIEVEGPHHNFIAGGYVVHNSVGADKQFMHNRKNPKKIAYKHRMLKEVLGDTSGLIIFQEQLQQIYHRLAGVPLEETDAVRKAFTKKEIATQREAKKERQRLRQDFIDKCKATNRIPERTSSAIFDEMQKYVKYSFNLSHAYSYATISYQCAHLLTYYPDEWIATYIDYCVNDKGKVTGYDDPKVVALGEARALGYQIGNVDINLSGREFEVKKGTLVPSFSSLKSVGTVALNEIEQFRPYKTVEDLLWNPDDTWRHSKLNKRAMSTLVKLGAFESMGIVGNGKQFENYRQLHYVLVENGDKLKRAISKKKKDHKEVLAKLIEEANQLPEWTAKERIKFSKDLAGIVDLNLIVTPEVRDYLENKAGVKSIDNWANDGTPYWAIVDNCKLATTKNGKKYCRVKLYGESGSSQLCFMWNYNPVKDQMIPDNSLVIGFFKKSGFGLSAAFGKLEVF